MVIKTTKKNSLKSNFTPSELTLKSVRDFARSFQSKNSEILEESLDWVLN
tara:strand:- start:8261 stop:8410 length:150 start_codon:yes stop_codon:yes gene_type:complete